MIRNRVLSNDNGHSYAILAGKIDESALLMRLDDEAVMPYIIVYSLGNDDWYGGEYYGTLSEAYEEWSKNNG